MPAVAITPTPPSFATAAARRAPVAASPVHAIQSCDNVGQGFGLRQGGKAHGRHFERVPLPADGWLDERRYESYCQLYAGEEA